MVYGYPALDSDTPRNLNQLDQSNSLLTRMTSPACSKPGLIIRRANLDDARLLTALGARTFSETFAADNSDADMETYLASAFSEEQQTAELADPKSTIFIAESDGVAVGYAMLGSGKSLNSITNDKPIELVRLYVSRDQIGLGVGAALMQLCIKEAACRGYRTLWLGVWENNQRAQAFYRKWEP